LPKGPPQRRFLEGPDWAILLEVREDRRTEDADAADRELPAGGQALPAQRRDTSLHLYSRSELLAELSRAGFEARLLGGYGRFRFAPAHAGFLARKPR
jgi:hypothetical protein